MHSPGLKTESGTAGIGEGPPKRRWLYLLLGGAVFFITALLAALLLPAQAQEAEKGQGAMLRMAHLSPDAPGVNVYIDDQPIDALNGVRFKNVSPYLPLPAGTHNIKVYLAAGGASDPLLEANVNLEDGESYTVAPVGLVKDGSLTAKLYQDDNSPPPEGKARLRMIHAVPDIGPATVGAGGGEKNLLTLPGFSNASDYVEVPEGTYDLKMRGAGTDIIVNFSILDIPLSAGEVYTAFVVGRAADGTLELVLATDSANGSELLPESGGPGEARGIEEGPGVNASGGTETTDEIQEPETEPPLAPASSAPAPSAPAPPAPVPSEDSAPIIHTAVGSSDTSGTTTRPPVTAAKRKAARGSSDTSGTTTGPPATGAGVGSPDLFDAAPTAPVKPEQVLPEGSVPVTDAVVGSPNLPDAATTTPAPPEPAPQQQPAGEPAAVQGGVAAAPDMVGGGTGVQENLSPRRSPRIDETKESERLSKQLAGSDKDTRTARAEVTQTRSGASSVSISGDAGASASVGVEPTDSFTGQAGRQGR